MTDACIYPVVSSGSPECLNTSDDPLEVLKTQLQGFTELFLDGNEGGRQI